MTTESPIRMLDSDESKKWLPATGSGLFSSPFSNVAGHEGVGKVLQETIVRKEQTRMMPSRSGSAPPTIEGSIVGFQAFMDQQNSSLTSSSNEFLDCEPEEQMRTDPAYIQYYYANVNLNPRLPPPLISRENRRLVQHMESFVGKKVSAREGFLAAHKEEPEEANSPHEISGDQGNFVDGTKMTSEVGHNGSSGDLKEGDFVQAPSSASSTTIKEGSDHDNVRVSNTDDEHSTMSSSINPSVSTVSYCRTADLEDNVSIQSNIGSEVSVVESRMKLLDVSGEIMREEDQKRLDYLHLLDENKLHPHPSQGAPYQISGFQAYAVPRGMYAAHQKPLPLHQAFMHNTGLVPPLYASTAAHMNSGNLFYPSVPQPGFPSPPLALSGLSANTTLPPHFGSYVQGNAFPMPIDTYGKPGFFKQSVEALLGEMNPYASQVLRPSFGGPAQGQSFQQLYENAHKSAVQSQIDALASQRDTVASASSIGGRGLNHPAINIPSLFPLITGTQLRFNSYGYPPSLGEPQFQVPPTLPGSSVPRIIQHGLGNDVSVSQQSSKSTAAYPGWKRQGGPESSDRNSIDNNAKRPSFLELLKSNSSRILELSEISGQIVEFSTDQHGSRFIQQKLESCGSDEKESVFKEVLPQVAKLMTDVFGNYVVQKFFEHGTVEQRRKLGQQLTGQVLTLSLQMYGCRVIQKALEVIELDQKVELMKELDGHVMKCVHDQNGNHVIQKCIEFVPTEKIKFIISSFIGQVATLSCHPYGCRVIQRVLEHCSDEQISQWMVDEVLKSTSTLAHDPYGNYVTQHVMEMGKPHQRSQIIHKLTGRFVQLSQHKFASNVAEKCIKFGSDSERNLIIEEIIAQSDNNEALLMMMKDQFANYVVQKIFEIGSEKQKETLQNCIRLHLPVLKKVPYAKHIVSRYDQLTEGSEQETKQCTKMADSVASTSE
ncbi:pumilio homolog 5-like isoform X2 [Chenopodium quinoa]|uniref:pumilio homolog 5-like isoform X2 n=1 Tax=Chenopodium quinoa TaxID=63459 RepID=UPI000B798F64|nr:pumilio homolog 5-like isoform X2 [Chenopodium quinoa]